MKVNKQVNYKKEEEKTNKQTNKKTTLIIMNSRITHIYSTRFRDPIVCDTDSHRQSETLTGEESGDGSREREDSGARDQSVQRCRGQQQPGVRGEELHGREAHPQAPGHPHPASLGRHSRGTPTEAVAKREFGILIEGECISLSCQVTFCFSSSRMYRWYKIERFDTFLEFSSLIVKSLCFSKIRVCVCGCGVGGWEGACVRA